MNLGINNPSGTPNWAQPTMTSAQAPSGTPMQTGTRG